VYGATAKGWGAPDGVTVRIHPFPQSTAQDCADLRDKEGQSSIRSKRQLVLFGAADEEQRGEVVGDRRTSGPGTPDAHVGDQDPARGWCWS